MFPAVFTAVSAKIGERDLFFAAAVEDYFAHAFGQFCQRRVNVEVVMFCQALQHLKIEPVSPVPTTDGARRQAERGIADDARRVKELPDTEAVAAGTGPGRIIEREKPRF